MIVWQDKVRKEKIDALCRLVPKKRFELLTLDNLCRENDGTFSTVETETGYLPDRSFRSFFMYYEGKRLVGELFVFPVDDHTAEITAIVDPCRRRCGIFTRLFECAKEELAGYGISDMMLVAEPASSDAREVIGHLGLCLLRSEFVMERDASNLDRADETEDDTEFVFEETEGVTVASLIRSKASKKTKASKKKEIPIGMAKAVKDKDTAFIFEVEIQKDHRGMGYGGRLMNALMKHLAGSGHKTLFRLQVSSDNGPACALYKKLGFKPASQLDYFVVDKNKKP